MIKEKRCSWMKSLSALTVLVCMTAVFSVFGISSTAVAAPPSAEVELDRFGVQGSVACSTYGHNQNGFMARVNDRVYIVDQKNNRIASIENPEDVFKDLDKENSKKKGLFIAQFLIQNDSWEVQKTDGKDKLPEQPKNTNRVEEAIKEKPLPMTEEEKMRKNLIPPSDEFIKKLADKNNLVYTIGKGGDERFYADDGTPIYPSNDGAVGKKKIITLKAGEKILTRYGYETGRFVSPIGTSFEERALPRTTDKNNYHEYVVTKDIERVISGTIAPWFGQKGGGIQYKLPDSIENLKDFLQEVTENDV